MQVINGNNIDILKQYPDNYFDSIVTDPPYGLGKEPNAEELMKDWIEKGYHEVSGSGFMGKQWDAFVPQPVFWKEVFRVLKPGGHILAFYGTRTYDWGVMAMRFAGFEVRDCIQWLYGCLSEDTEILTKGGYIQYHKFKKLHTFEQEEILIYDIETDNYKWEKPESWNEYNIKDTCYRIQSDNTDQIVSRNHRCLVEREGILLYEFAEIIAQEQQANIPFLENLPKLSEPISDIYKRTSNTKQNLLQKMCIRKSIKKNERQIKAITFKVRKRNSMFYLSKNILEGKRMVKKSKNINLLKKMQRLLSWSRLEETRTQGEKSMVGRNEGETSAIYNWRKESSLEGRNNLSKKERLLFGSETEICEMSNGVYSNVEERWVCSGVSVSNGETIEQTIIKNGVRTSHRPQPNEQRYNESNVICNEQGTQAIRVGKSYSTTLATITPIEYSGVIFCPTVSTGCFVARRNGQVFITGNSGFPKSHNVGKSVDKIQGNEREVVGTTKTNGIKAITKSRVEQGYRKNLTIANSRDERELDKGNSVWEGFGSALKPANEPIVLARKPLEKGLSIAENVLKWGTGAINIDGCRVGFKNEADYKESTQKNQHEDFGTKPMTNNNVYGDYSMIQPKNYEPKGRFPANLILTHHPECECVGTKKVKAIKGGVGGSISMNEQGFGFKKIENGANAGGLGDENGEETIENWNCHEDCPIKILDEQSGESKSQKSMRGEGGGGDKVQQLNYRENSLRGHSDKGGASRFFYVAKASKSERNKGLEGFEEKFVRRDDGQQLGMNTNEYRPDGSLRKEVQPKSNFHPTVKPIELMKYLVRLVTPPNGIVLDPFCGSGTTGIACKLEGFDFVGCEQDAEYCKIAQARIDNYIEEKVKKSSKPKEDNNLQPTLF